MPTRDAAAARILPAHDTRGFWLGGFGLLPGPHSARRGRSRAAAARVTRRCPAASCAPPHRTAPLRPIATSTLLWIPHANVPALATTILQHTAPRLSSVYQTRNANHYNELKLRAEGWVSPTLLER